MSAEESGQNQKSNWHKKRTPILENIEKAITLRKFTLKDLSDAQKNLDEATELIKYDITRLDQIKGIFANNTAYLPTNPVTEGSVDIMTNLSAHDSEAAQFLASTSKFIRTNTDRFRGTVIVSGSTVSSMATTAIQMADSMENNEAIQPFIIEIKEPTARDRKIELCSKLSEIDNRLATKLEGAWQTLHDVSKADRFLQAASSARELISDLLHLLSPDDQVKAMPWFKKETESGNPTQRQRARYAMLGQNNVLGDDELRAIYTLSDDIRDAYTKLNKIAHLRNYNTDLQKLTESLIDQCQIYLLQLLKMRSTYFKA